METKKCGFVPQYTLYKQVRDSHEDVIVRCSMAKLKSMYLVLLRDFVHFQNDREV